MSEERKYEPTPKQRLEAQRRGQFAYSSDLVGAVVFLFAIISLSMIGTGVFNALKEQLISSFAFQPSDLQVPDAHSLRVGCWSILGRWFAITSPFWILAIVGAVLSHFSQRRFLFAPQREIFSDKNINPIEGLQKIFSIANLVKTGTAIIKAVVLVLILYFFCRNQLEAIVGLIQIPLSGGVSKMYSMIWNLLIRLSIALLVLGSVDYLWQYWKFERSIRMTEQQMRDEMKNE